MAPPSLHTSRVVKRARGSTLASSCTSSSEATRSSSSSPGTTHLSLGVRTATAPSAASAPESFARTA